VIGIRLSRMLKNARFLTHPSLAHRAERLSVRFCTLSFYAKRERRWRNFSASCQFRQIDFERDSRDTDLPSFEDFWVQFPNHTDVFPVRHDTSDSPSKK
jgi:hypothetical protein